MRSRLRRHLRSLLFSLTVVSWISGQLAVSIHQATTWHTRCIEHGELIEVSSAHANATSQSIHAPDSGHEHGCSLQDVLSLASIPPGAVQTALPSPCPELPLLTAAGGARAPPLRFAPKTSPPLIG